MTTLYRIPRIRHLRHSAVDRLRRARHLLTFIVERAATLSATGAAKTLTLGSNAYGATATGTLTASTRPSDGDTVTINGRVYTFRTTLSTGPTVADEVLIGADVAATHTNLTAAINGTAGEGTTYSADTLINDDVTAVAGATTTVLTSKLLLLEAGNAVTTTENGTNTSFGAATLTGGADPTGNIAISSHGYSVGDGPFLLTTDDELPGGLEEGVFYYVQTVVSAGVVRLTTSLKDMNLVDITSAGTGNHTITKAASEDAVFDTMKRNHPKVVAAATDIDTL